MHQIVRRILNHRNFFIDHALLLFNLLRLKSAVIQHIRQQFNARQNMLVYKMDVEASAFLGRKSVEHPAYIIYLSGNILSRAF